MTVKLQEQFNEFEIAIVVAVIKIFFCKRREMVYTCKHCGKCFDGLSGLKRHKVIHSRKKPYVCSHCGKAFTDTSNCWQNKRTQHKKVTWEHAFRKKMQQTEH